MKDKSFYRNCVAKQRASITKDHKDRLDRIIYNKLIESNEYRQAKVIFIYVSYKNEVDTHNIIKTSLKEGKVVFVPKIISVKEGMVAVKINTFEELKESKYGILEPELILDRVLKPEDIDVVYAPGVAFDISGGRIGYGGGFYDRFFSSLNRNIPKIALAYSFQVFDKVPMDDRDIYMDEVITD